MKKKTTKITELVISEENEALAIDAISLVSSPALEVDFVFFGKEKNNLTFAKVDEEKRELIAPALIPLKNIYRYDANLDQEYYVYFSKDTVKKAAYSYLKHNNHHKATYEHQQRVAGVLTVESWIIEDTDKDKSSLYGFSLPAGSWMVKMSIENEDLWQKIKEGELKGLSIEGYFVDKLEKMSKTFTDEEIQTAYKELQAEGKITKVELELIDDLSKELDKAKKVIKEVTNLEKKIQSEQKVLMKQASDYNKLAKNLDNFEKEKSPLHSKIRKLIDTIRKDAKALGVNPNTLEGMQEAIKIVDTLSKRSRFGMEADVMFVG